MLRTVLVSAAWVGAGIAFGLVVALWQGGDAGQEYFAAYLIEKARAASPWASTHAQPFPLLSPPVGRSRA